MFSIGKIKDFGGPYGDANYGKIKQISPTHYEDVFFHMNDVSNISKLKSDFAVLLSEPYVAYNLVDDTMHPGKVKADKVVLIKEVKSEALHRLINENYLHGSEIDSLMRQYCFEYCMGDDPIDYIRFLEDASVKKKLMEMVSSHSLRSSFCSAAIVCLEKDIGSISSIINASVYGYESEEEVANLCVYIKTHYFNRDISPILNCMPLRFLLRRDISEILETNEIDGIKVDVGTEDYQALYELATQSDNEKLRNKIVSVLPVEIALASENLAAGYNDDKLVQWLDSSWPLVEKGQYSLLKYIEEDLQPKAALSIAEHAVKMNLCFASEIWDNLSDSCKVRMIIYVSNFRVEQLWFERMSNLVVGKDNELIRGLLYLLMIHYYLETDEDIETEPDLQQLFETGHNLIMDYITDVCFPHYILQDKSVPHDLNSLMEKCMSDYPRLKKYYCDARIWNMSRENRTTVFCPRGKNFDLEGHECRFRDSELTATRYTVTKGLDTQHYNTQHFVDFIHNLHIEPDVSFMCSGRGGFNWAEYPFKMSAYINMLINFAPHMKCRCGAILVSDASYSKKIDARVPATVFYCPVGERGSDEERLNHDMDVYLNYCHNCEGQIDSRECRLQERNYNIRNGGYYHCMFCGTAENVTRCPQCGERNAEQITYARNRPITCRSCGHSGNTWKRIQREKGIPLRFEIYHQSGAVNAVVDHTVEFKEESATNYKEISQTEINVLKEYGFEPVEEKKPALDESNNHFCMLNGKIKFSTEKDLLKYIESKSFLEMVSRSQRVPYQSGSYSRWSGKSPCVLFQFSKSFDSSRGVTCELQEDVSASLSFLNVQSEDEYKWKWGITYYTPHRSGHSGGMDPNDDQNKMMEFFTNLIPHMSEILQQINMSIRPY